MSKAYTSDGARTISCPKCDTQILNPGTDVYKCSSCSTFYLAKGSGHSDSGDHKNRKRDGGRPRSSGGSSTPESAKLIHPPAGPLNPSNCAGNLLRPKESQDIEERSDSAAFSDSETSSSVIWSSEIASPNAVLEVMPSDFGKWNEKKGSARSLRGVHGSGSTHQYESLGVAEGKVHHWLPLVNSETRMDSGRSNEHDDLKPQRDKVAIRYGELSNNERIQHVQRHLFDLKVLGISDANLPSKVKPEFNVMENGGIQETKLDDYKVPSRHELCVSSAGLVGTDTGGVMLAQSNRMTEALPDAASYDTVPHQRQGEVIDSLTVEPDPEFLMYASGYSSVVSEDWERSTEQVNGSSGRSAPLRWSGTKKGSDSLDSRASLKEEPHLSRDLQNDQSKQESHSRSVRSRRRSSTSGTSDFKGSNPVVESGSHQGSSLVATQNARSHDTTTPITRDSHSYHGHGMKVGHYDRQTSEPSAVSPFYLPSPHCVICVHERYHVPQAQVSPESCASCGHSEQSNSPVQQSSLHTTTHPQHREAELMHHRSEINGSASATSRKRKIYPPLPGKGAAPYVLCKHCEQLLQVPRYLHPKAGSFQRLKCGDCGQVSRFYVVDGTMQPFDTPAYILHDDESEVNPCIQEQGPSSGGASGSLQRSQNSVPAGAPLIDHLARSIRGVSRDLYRRHLLESFPI